MRTELSKFILSFEELNYHEVDFVMKKLWVGFEVEWEKECQKKVCLECHEDGADQINTNEGILKASFVKVMKNLTLDVYESKAAALKRTSLS